MSHVAASAAVPRILIVDDDPGTIRVLIQILKDLGRIDFATSGPQAIDMATANCPDLILLDIEMSGMDGFAVCQTLKSDRVLADVPILFVTIHDDIDNETRAIEMGGVDYITKPPIPAVVRARVKNQLALKSRTDALLKSNLELEQFACVLSHDLREPLRMVSSYLGLIERRLGRELDGDLKVFFEFATGGASRMAQMLNDLLDFSRIGRSDHDPEPVDLGEVVADALANLGMAFHDGEATVTVADGLPTVSGYRSELVRLFQNLISNALKYRAADRGPVIQVGADEAGDEWRVWVRDNGIGIDEADRERVFTIFQRLAPHEDHSGTGVGLAVAKKIVTHLGGRIWIESEAGQGSCFFFTLPKEERA
ncbi:MAG TPA: ATP-binding protein [Patescibacteria group bacterium]|nr:ATP-binding protein [Patescibacteria group bacterium]